MNGLPHLIQGVSGNPFPTPFAQPPGRGKSPAWVNVLWGGINLLAGYALLSYVGFFTLGLNLPTLSLVSGAMMNAIALALLFSKSHQ